MSDRTSFIVGDAKNCVFFRLEEGPKNMKTFLSVQQARELAKRLWGAAAAVEEEGDRQARKAVGL